MCFGNCRLERYKEVTWPLEWLHPERSMSILVRDMPIRADGARFVVSLCKCGCFGIVFAEHAAGVEHFDGVDAIDNRPHARGKRHILFGRDTDQTVSRSQADEFRNLK